MVLPGPSLSRLSASKTDPFLKAAQSPCSKHLQKVLEPTHLFQLTMLPSAHQKDRTLLAGIPQLLCTARKCKARLAKSSAIYFRHLKERPGCKEYSARSEHPTYFPYQHDLAPTEIPTAASSQTWRNQQEGSHRARTSAYATWGTAGSHGLLCLSLSRSKPCQAQCNKCC